MNTSSAVCQEPFGQESGRSAENRSLKPSARPSRIGRRCVYLITLFEMLRHCNEHGHTHRVLCSLLYVHSNQLCSLQIIGLHPEKHIKYFMSLTPQSSEDKLRRVLKETRERHEAEIGKALSRHTSHTHCWNQYLFPPHWFLALQQV